MSSSTSQSISQPHTGLISCGADYNSPFCITKTIQFIISGILLITTIIVFIQRIRRQRQLNFFVIISIEMMITLLFNMMRSLIHDIQAFYYIQVFFFDAYFITIVYSVSLRLINQANIQKKYKIVCHCLFAGYMLMNLAFILYDALKDYSHCSQLDYLIMDLIAIFFSIVLLIAGLRYHQIQKKRLIGIHGQANIKNPLPYMWIWIIINILCQIVNFTESMIFQFVDKDCKFSQNKTINQTVKLLFTIFSYYIGMIATLIFFKQKYIRNQFVQRSSLRKDSTDDQNGNIELMVHQITPYYVNAQNGNNNSNGNSNKPKNGNFQDSNNRVFGLQEAL